MKESFDPRRDAFLAAMGEELRSLREQGGLSQQQLADLFEWGRDAVSKIETGKTNIGLYEYVRLMRFLRDLDPTHPAVALGDRLIPRKGRAR